MTIEDVGVFAGMPQTLHRFKMDETDYTYPDRLLAQKAATRYLLYPTDGTDEDTNHPTIHVYCT